MRQHALRTEHHDGTITIVFSDIERSTEQVADRGDRRWKTVIDAHDHLVRRVVTAAGGTVVKGTGDGFMLTFPSARRAVEATMVVQQMIARGDHDELEGIRLRIGLHTGEVVVDGAGDLFGLHVNLAARIAATADGGEILASSVTKAILDTSGEIEFAQPRSAEFKGIPGRHMVHPVSWTEAPDSVTIDLRTTVLQS